MRDALQVHRALLEAGVPHGVERLRRPVASAEELPDVLGVPPERCVVVRCYTAGGGTVAVAVPAGSEPRPAALRRALHADDVGPAGDAEVNAATDCAARLVSPVGLPAGVELLLDAALVVEGPLWVATGDAGTAVQLSGIDLLAVSGARVVALAEPVAPVTVTVPPVAAGGAQEGRPGAVRSLPGPLAAAGR